jgi:hypothetical protein
MSLQEKTRGKVRSVLWLVVAGFVSIVPLPCVAMGRLADLNGFWAGDDGAMYFVTTDDWNRVWWVGMSGDDGQSFTNVFQGKWNPNNATEEPADFGTVSGDWVDVPRGQAMGSGTLTLSYRTNGEIWRTSGSGFGGKVWRKIDRANVPETISARSKFFPSQGDLNGIWSNGSGTYYVRQLGSTVWWFGIREKNDGPEAEIFRGVVNGNRLEGTLAFPPWTNRDAGGTNGLHLQLDRANSPTSFTRVPGIGHYSPGTTWRRLGG